MIYLLFFLLCVWCGYLTKEIHDLKNVRNNSSPPTVDDTPPSMHEHPLKPGVYQESLIQQAWRYLIQHIPRYETTTWIGLVLGCVGLRYGYRYLVEHGYYQPSEMGGYMTVGIITATILWKWSHHVVGYLIATALSSVGLTLVSQQFGDNTTIAVMSSVALVVSAWCMPRRFHAYTLLGMGGLGVINAYLHAIPPYAVMGIFFCYMWRFSSHVNILHFAVYEAITAWIMLASPTFTWSAYGVIMMGMIALMPKKILHVHDISWSVSAAIAIIAAIAYQGHNVQMLWVIPFVYLLGVARYKHQYLSILTHAAGFTAVLAFALLTLMGTPFATLIQCVGASTLFVVWYNPLKYAVLAYWTLALFIPDIQIHSLLWHYIIASIFLLIYGAPLNVLRLSFFSAMFIPSQWSTRGILIALTAIAMPPTLYAMTDSYWGYYISFLAITVGVHQRNIRYWVLVMMALCAMLFHTHAFLLLGISILTLAVRFLKDDTILPIETLLHLAGLLWYQQMYVTASHSIWFMILLAYLLMMPWLRPQSHTSYAVGIITLSTAAMSLSHIDSYLLLLTLSTTFYTLWYMFISRGRYPVSTWNMWMWMMLGKVIILDQWGLTTHSWMYPLECITVAIVLIWLRRQLRD